VVLVTFAKLMTSIALLILLPGYLTRLAWFGRSVDHKPEDALQFGGQVLLFSAIWTGGLGVVLAQLGQFSLARLWLVSLSYELILVLWIWRSGMPWRLVVSGDRRERVALLTLVVIAGALFFHPHEFIWGGADAGVYVNLGANIARTGAWRIYEPLIAEMDPALYPAMFREQPAPLIPQYVPLPGTYLTNSGAGEVTPQFYPLHPVWLAILYAVGGLRFSLYATPFWGLLGCVMVYLSGRIVFSRRVGMLSALFLALTATQIWFSRYPTSEVLTQMLLFGGICSFTLYLRENESSGWQGFLAGLAFGQALLSRIDLYVLAVLPVVFALYCRLNGLGRRRFWLFSAPFCVCLAYSLFFAANDSWPYLHNTYSPLLSQVSPTMMLTGGSIASAALIAAWVAVGPKYSSGLRVWLDRVGNPGFRGMAVIVGLLAMYAYFVRPLTVDPGTSFYYWYGDHDIPNVEPYNFVRLGWYLSPLGLLLSVVGVCLALARGPNRRFAPLLGIGLLFSIVYLYSSMNNPHHIYVMRRYVPVVIPFFLLMAAYALDRLMSIGKKWGRRASLVASVCLAIWLLVNSRYAIPHVEYQGLISQFESFSEDLGDQPSVLLFNDVRAVGPAAILGTPLRYLKGFYVFDLQEDELEAARLEQQISIWQRAGYRVLVLEGEQPGYLMADTPARESQTSFVFEYPMLETSYEHFPRAIWSIRVPIWYWQVPNESDSN
jgi:hypothetical protein